MSMDGVATLIGTSLVLFLHVHKSFLYILVIINCGFWLVAMFNYRPL